MKATEFVKKYGIEFAKKWFVKNVGDTPTHQKYVNIVDGEPKGIISTASYGGFHVAELKRLIDSHELVAIHGYARSKSVVADAPSDDHYYSWALGDSGVYDKTVNIGELRKAIADVEACQ